MREKKRRGCSSVYSVCLEYTKALEVIPSNTKPKKGSVSTLQATVGVFLQNNFMVSRADKKDVYTNA